MVKAVMYGYDESDMEGLFQSTRRKTRSTVIFILSIVAVILIIGIIYVVSLVFDKGLFSAGVKSFRWLFIFILGFGLLQFCGNPGAKLKSYPDSYKEGYIFTCFDNTEFYFTALQKQIVSTQELVNSAIGSIESKVKSHSYSELSKALEDRERLYLFFKSKDEYPLIIRKESVCDGTAEELKAILSAQLKDNYKTLRFKPIEADVW